MLRPSYRGVAYPGSSPPQETEIPDNEEVRFITKEISFPCYHPQAMPIFEIELADLFVPCVRCYYPSLPVNIILRCLKADDRQAIGERPPYLKAP